MIHQPIPRRTFLRGVGTMMALPLLEAMTPLPALAAPAKRKVPTRMAVLFVPNGMHMPAWTPATDGPGFESPSIMAPLETVRQSLLVISGLAQDKARPSGYGPGDHARSASALLTGCQPRKTAGADIKVGISVDQLAAQRL